MDSLKEKEIIKDAAAYASSLKEDEDNSDNNSNHDPDEANSGNAVSAQKHQEVQWHHGWKAKAYKGMPGGSGREGKMDATGHLIRPKFLSNHTHYSTTDRDARVAVKPGKPRQLNYLGQVSVDTASHVITHIQADYADKKDSQCLPSLLANTIANLKAEGLLVKEVLADAGYSSGEALKALEANNVTGYIPNFGQYKPSREGFTYHSEGNYYECERGTKLPYKKTYADRKGYEKKQYRSSAKDCARCPLRKGCIGARADYKKIEDAIDKPLYDRMHQRLQTKKAQRMKKLRQSTVEPVLGTLVNFLGMKRVNTRGIALAGKCMLMAATCYKVKKLLNFKAPRVKAAVKSVRKRAEKALHSLLVLLFTAITIPHFWYHRKSFNW